jgi:hypothetical protein
MTVSASLPGHVVFRELPFCGVLLDTDRSRVYRLSQEATAALRGALRAAAGSGPYEPAIRVAAPGADSAPARRLLETLSSQGLVRISPEDPRDAR